MKKLFMKPRALNKKGEPELTTITNNTPFAIREAFKSLYTNVLYLNIEDKCKKIAVTSAYSGEGKSCVSANLGITYALNSEEKRVLLIDVDMRQPKLAKLFSIDRKSHGLSEYLAGIDDTPNFIDIPEYKLTLLTSGATNVNPTKLIASSKMTELVKMCEERFDCIIFDTPPVTVVTDAIHLSNNVNGYIISTRADYSNVNGVGECIDILNRTGAEIFGVVLTSLKLKSNVRGKNGKYMSRYGGKYSYIQEESK